MNGKLTRGVPKKPQPMPYRQVNDAEIELFADLTVAAASF